LYRQYLKLKYYLYYNNALCKNELLKTIKKVIVKFEVYNFNNFELIAFRDVSFSNVFDFDKLNNSDDDVNKLKN